jgi:glycosyltransferase involved in cell wall biosynthesis
LSALPTLAVVLIGRNEGVRLTRCLESVRAMSTPPGGALEIIYVDSGSTDGSPYRAAQLGATVISVTPPRPCAAAGHNAGWQAAHAEFVLFLDGDTTVAPDFVLCSMSDFDDPAVAIVLGNRREIDPAGSIFNRLLDLDWITPAGLADYCGGDALVRRSVLEAVGGYDERLIAGEEPEMCRRIRGLGFVILHVDRAMTSHDLGIKRRAQYWRRAVRTGYAYGEVAQRFHATDSPLWDREARRNLLHGCAMVALVAGAPALALALRSNLPMLAAIVIIATLALRTAWRFRWKSPDFITGFLFGLHSHFQQIPILLGQLKYRSDRRRGRTAELI